MLMVYLSHTDYLEQGNTSGASQLELLRRVTLNHTPVPVLVEDLLPPMWVMITSVRVGILGQHQPMYCMQVTHSGMVRGVDPLPAVN